MSLVLDTSLAIAWAYAAEATAAVRSVLDQVVESGACVPALWYLEVANILEMGVRRGRCDAAFRDATLADMMLLEIEVDGQTDVRAWEETLTLAMRHRLTVYDAAYLELALRRGLPLATLDQELRCVAEREGLAVLGV